MYIVFVYYLSIYLFMYVSIFLFIYLYIYISTLPKIIPSFLTESYRNRLAELSKFRPIAV